MAVEVQVTVIVVAAIQAVIVAAVAAVAWWWAGAAVAQAVAGGGGCACAGTLAYVAGQALVPGRSASRLLWGHLLGETAKVAVAVSLLFWGLSADRGFAAGPFLAGFIVALLAYPLAMPLLKSK